MSAESDPADHLAGRASPPAPGMTRVRTIFLSDIHLGTRACQAGRLLEFLRSHEAEHIYLLGDIVDFWSLSREIHWPALHNTFVQKMLKRARHGVRVVFVPGNHDEALREYAGSAFGDIHVAREAVHVAADGRRYLLVHGDEFDQITRYHRWLAELGDLSYSLLVRINILLSWVRRKAGVPGYWSLAGYAKRKVKGALDFIYGFEESVARHARQRGMDGVVCGHIHSAAFKHIEGVRYINCGDWVDSCSAVLEHMDGRIELVHWEQAISAGLQADLFGDAHERDTHANGRPLADPVAQGKPRGRKNDDGGAVLEPAHLLALGEARVALDAVGSAIAQVQQHVEEVQADAGDQDRGDRHQRHYVV
jgi:UDP-2,3-diacylglucosamine pyrophosphatase LpxH